jgi:hypothetical protein
MNKVISALQKVCGWNVRNELRRQQRMLVAEDDHSRTLAHEPKVKPPRLHVGLPHRTSRHILTGNAESTVSRQAQRAAKIVNPQVINGKVAECCLQFDIVTPVPGTRSTCCTVMGSAGDDCR